MVEKLQLILPQGNSLVIDVLDATLALPTGNEFTQVNPAPGIREVKLNEIDENSIRLTIQKFGYTFSHEFSDRWQIRNNFSAAITDEGSFKFLD